MIGFSTRLSFAFRCFFSLLFQGEIPQDVLQALGSSKPTIPAKPVVDKPSPESLDRAVQMLALFQRDGRLVDFLTEDVSPYPDRRRNDRRLERSSHVHLGHGQPGSAIGQHFHRLCVVRYDHKGRQ
jgi:hypothetical protein